MFFPAVPVSGRCVGITAVVACEGSMFQEANSPNGPGDNDESASLGMGVSGKTSCRLPYGAEAGHMDSLDRRYVPGGGMCMIPLVIHAQCGIARFVLA